MKKLSFVRANCLDKLCEEINSAGLPFTAAVTGKGDEIYIYVPDTATDADIATINNIVANHDPTPPPPPPSLNDLLVQAIQAASTLDELKAAVVQVIEGAKEGAPGNG